MDKYDAIIVGTGPAGMGAAYIRVDRIIADRKIGFSYHTSYFNLSQNRSGHPSSFLSRNDI